MKAILKKMDLIVNLKGFALVLLGVGMLVSSQGAWGQESPEDFHPTNDGDPGPAEKLMKESVQVGRKLKTSQDNISNMMLPMRLPGDAEAPRADGASSKEETPPNALGKQENKNVNIVLPPLKGFRQLADAEPIQKMYKELINTKVPVLVQTMMMVENGAATGFIGSMNMVSNLMNNTIQTQQFQLELMNITDDTGQMKYAYAGKIQKAFKGTGGAGTDKVKSWPAALYVATGDSADVTTDGSTLDKIENIPKSEPFNLTDMPNMEESPPSPPGSPPSPPISFVKQMLMPKPPGGGPGAGRTAGDVYKNDEIQALQKELIYYVGDIKFELTAKGQGNVARENNITYIKPEDGDNKQWGLSLKARDETKKAWENINNLINELCKFKKQNPNKQLSHVERLVPSTGAKWTPQMWEDASAPDILMTQNLIEQLFSLSRQGKAQNEDLDCTEEFPEGKGLKVPFGGNFDEAKKEAPDLCKKEGGTVTPCLRFQATYHMASIIGTARALHTYHALQTISGRFVRDQATERLHNHLFNSLLGGEELGVFLDQNQDRWRDFTTYLGRYIQAQGHEGAKLTSGGNNATVGSGAGGT